MRILQICSAEGIGGGEAHVADLAVALAERGLSVDIAVRPSSELPAFLGARGGALRWHEVPLRNALDLKSVRALARIVDEREIDVVHAHVARDYPIAALACRAAPRARLVLTRHHYLPIKGNPLYRRLLASATIIAVSESVRRTVIDSLGADPSRVVTIPNWIDLARYADPPGRSTGRKHFDITKRVAVGTIGQLVPLKGHEELVRAAAAVVAVRSDVEFLVFGDDREPGGPHLSRLRALAVSLGIGAAVRFCGFTPDLPTALAALDVVAVPSWNEAFSLVTAEAMAAGKAIVASRAGALEELVDDGVTGLLVPPKDPAALATAILRLASDPALVESLGRSARDGASRFARDPRIAEVVRVYERAIRT